MQTLGEGDGFFSLPAERGADARERFRASREVKYEGGAGVPVSGAGEEACRNP